MEANIEQLDTAGLEEASFDLIVSNCVINLAVDKAAVLASAKKLLRPGGEMYFADVYVDRRIPDELKSDPLLYGECLAGAMYPPDFVRIAQETGFLAPLLVEESIIDITDADVQQRIGDLRFSSATYRLFNIEGLETTEENYGQKAIYLGDIPEHPEHIALSQQIEFTKGREVAVSGNISRILEGSRFSENFLQIGDESRHLGAFSSTSCNLPRFDIVAGTTVSSCC